MTLTRAPAMAAAPYRLSLNESPYGPLPAVARVLAAGVAEVNRYPDFFPDRLRAAIAAHLSVAADRISVGPGATGLAHTVLAESSVRARGRGVTAPTLVTSTPTFDGYPILAGMLGIEVRATRLDTDGGTDLDALAGAVDADTAAVAICSPHNPTGSVVSEDALVAFLREVPPSVTVIFDEAYAEFCDDPPDMIGLTRRFPTLVALRTFSKAHGLAALRVGYALAGAEMGAALRSREIPFAVGPAALAAVPVALAARAELDDRVRAMRTERARLSAMLTAIGASPLPSQGNFVFLPGDDGLQVGTLLSTVGVLGKRCGDFGFRLTVGDCASTDYLVGALRLTARTA